MNFQSCAVVAFVCCKRALYFMELILNFLHFSDQSYGRGSRSESFDNRFLANPVLLAEVLNSVPGPSCIRLLQKVQYCFSVHTNVRQPETLAVVSAQINFWVMGAEISYWWRITTQIWVVFLIGWSKYTLRHDQSEALPISEKWYVISMESSDVILRWNQWWCRLTL